MPDQWNVYLSGEIHSDWRQRIIHGAEEEELPVTFSSAITDHAASDSCGVDILGAESDSFWVDRKGAGVNAIRTRTLLSRADLIVVRFGEKYRQWNAAFEAGLAVAEGTPLVTLHDESLDHAMKEINAAAYATARTPEQVVQLLAYVTQDQMIESPVH